MVNTSNGVAISDHQQFLLDVMVTAFEGGCNYWAVASKVKRDAELHYLQFDVRSSDNTDGDWHTITPEKIGIAIMRMLTGEVKVRRDIAGQFVGYPHNVDQCDCDAEGADCAVQVAAFGEIVFG